MRWPFVSERKSCSPVWFFVIPWKYSPWHYPGQTTGVSSCSLLQQIFLTQESNWCLLHCRQFLYQLSYKGSCPLSYTTYEMNSKFIKGLNVITTIEIFLRGFLLPLFRVSQKWNHIVCNLLCLLSLNVFLRICWHCCITNGLFIFTAKLYSFVWMKEFALSTHLLIDVWFVSRLGLFGQKLLWIFLSKFWPL